MSLSLGIKRRIFQRYYSWCLEDYNLIELEYPVRPKPRFLEGHAGLLPQFEGARSTFGKFIDQILILSEELMAIAEARVASPTFINEFFLGLDACAYYSAVASLKPSLLIEVGSGHSTRFARAAIQANSPATRLISIDPSPRAEISLLCDEAFRTPLEDVDQGVFARLQAGDILFIDNSHRAFQNSDVTVFFVEILPNLPAGCILHIHDILLPYDYPPEWRRRFYSEQYLLACWMLANPLKFDLLFSCAFASRDPALCSKIAPLWDDVRFRKAKAQSDKIMGSYKGYSFWAKIQP